MSEGFLASAQVEIIPNAARFAELLKTQVAAAVAAAGPVEIPVVAVGAGVGAGAGTALLEQNTAATAENASVKQEQGAAAKQLATQEGLATAATQANISVLADYNALAYVGLKTTTDLAKAKAVEAASTKVLTDATAALDKALASQDAALIAAATETRNLALSQVQSAEAATAEAAAQTRAAASVRSSAAAHEQLGRGAGSSLLTLLGIRGATLAASAPFLAGAAAVVTFKKSIDLASSSAEALARLERVLGGPISQQLEESSKGLATSFQLSSDQALKAEGAFAELFHNVGLSNEQAGQLSEQMVKLAADVAAFNNVSLDQTLKAIQLGLAGNTRGLKQYGIVLTQAQVTQEALRESGKQYSSQLSQQEIILARLKLIQQDSANQLGAAAARSKDLAGQSRILKANLANLGEEIGLGLVPALNAMAIGLNNVFKAFQGQGDTGHRLRDLFGEIGQDKLKNLQLLPKSIADIGAQDNLPRVKAEIAAVTEAIREGFGPFGKLADIEKALVARQQELTADSHQAGAAMRDTTGAVRGLSGVMGILVTGTNAGAAALDKLASSATRVQTAIGTAQALGQTGTEQRLRAQRLAQNRSELLRLQSAEQTKKVVARENQLQTSIAQDEGRLTSIQQDASTKRKDAAQKIQQENDAADQALLRGFGTQQSRITDALINAGPKQAIALTIKLRNLYRKQREEARKQIKDLQTKKDTLAADTTEIKTLNKQIKDLNAQQANALADQAQAASGRATRHISKHCFPSRRPRPGTRRRPQGAWRALIRSDQDQIDRITALKKKRHRLRTRRRNSMPMRVDLAQRQEALKGCRAGQEEHGRTGRVQLPADTDGLRIQSAREPHPRKRTGARGRSVLHSADRAAFPSQDSDRAGVAGRSREASLCRAGERADRRPAQDPLDAARTQARIGSPRGEEAAPHRLGRDGLPHPGNVRAVNG